MKILIVSNNSLSQTRNNGKTLKMMFSEFDKSELCQFFCRGNGDVDFTAASNFYYISDIQVLKKMFMPWKTSGYVVKHPENNTQQGQAYTKGPIIPRTAFTQYLRELVWGSAKWDDRAFWKWIDQNHPDAVFFMGSYSIYMHRIVRKIHKRNRIPVITYFTDDYIIYPNDSFYKYLLIKEYRKTIAESSLCYAIGDDMAEEYSAFFKKPFKAIMNIVPFKDWSDNKETKKVIISYFGSLYYDRDKAIKHLAQFIKDKAKDFLKVDYTIRVYSASILSQKEIDEFKSLNVEIKGFVSGERMLKAQNETDINLHVESDNEDYKKLTKLCVSTKIPEYLISSKPTIAFGPKDVASIKIFASIDERMVISSEEVSIKGTTVSNNLVELINDVNVRNDIASKCHKYACKHYLRETVAKEFKRSIIEVIKGK